MEMPAAIETNHNILKQSKKIRPAVLANAAPAPAHKMVKHLHSIPSVPLGPSHRCDWRVPDRHEPHPYGLHAGEIRDEEQSCGRSAASDYTRGGRQGGYLVAGVRPAVFGEGAEGHCAGL